MRKNKEFLYALLAAMTATGFVSCSSDEPFGEGDGEGILMMQTFVNKEVQRDQTRAESHLTLGDTEEDLRAKCVVYVSGEKGLIYKYRSLAEMPEQLKMPNGHYVAEAWTGDSVSASYDKRFYRAYQPFDINSGVTNVTLNCKIANVVGSVKSSTIDPEIMKDWKVTFSHTRASLDVTEENQSDRCYFMMPNGDNNLKYTVTGKRADGKDFSKEGVIENVQRGHEYIINFRYQPSTTPQGGALITVVIEDENITSDENIPIYGRPSISGTEFDLNDQIYAEPGNFTEKILKVACFGDLTELRLNSADYAAFGMPASEIDILNASESVKNSLNNAGLTWDKSTNSEKNMTTSYLHFSGSLLNSLPKRDTEYVMSVKARDNSGKETTAEFHIAVGQGAIIIKDPVITDAIPANDYMAVGARRATLTGQIVNGETTNAGIEYREAGTDAWTFAAASNVKASRKRIKTRATSTFSVTLTGLKPGTRYEYRAASDGFQSSEVRSFTTEGIFLIPNAGMEEWSTLSSDDKIVIPAGNGTVSFWDSGNHGSKLAEVTLTQGVADMFHSGAKSAKLRSQKATVWGLGKFAAGNLFAGSFDGLQGTDGKLTFGREYNSSHPSALKLWANYVPEEVQEAKQNLKVGDTDLGQIFVALTTEPVQILTKASNRKLFNKDEQCVLAYGEVTWDKPFGASGHLEEVTIPITYYERAKTNKPLYLVIVCSASKYGDYFEGGEGSTMYVDDFELIYE